MIVNIPDMKAIEMIGESSGWTRERMLEEYIKQLTQGNPRFLNKDSSEKPLWRSVLGR